MTTVHKVINKTEVELNYIALEIEKGVREFLAWWKENEQREVDSDAAWKITDEVFPLAQQICESAISLLRSSSDEQAKKIYLPLRCIIRRIQSSANKFCSEKNRIYFYIAEKEFYQLAGNESGAAKAVLRCFRKCDVSLDEETETLFSDLIDYDGLYEGLNRIDQRSILTGTFRDLWLPQFFKEDVVFFLHGGKRTPIDELSERAKRKDSTETVYLSKRSKQQLRKLDPDFIILERRGKFTFTPKDESLNPRKRDIEISKKKNDRIQGILRLLLMPGNLTGMSPRDLKTGNGKALEMAVIRLNNKLKVKFIITPRTNKANPGKYQIDPNLRVVHVSAEDANKRKRLKLECCPNCGVRFKERKNSS